MKLERQEKEEGSSDQDKNGDQSDPKRIVVREIPLSLRYIFRSTERTSHCSMILIRSIREIDKKTKDFYRKKKGHSTQIASKVSPIFLDRDIPRKDIEKNFTVV
jgi:hypothetical protein